MLFCPIRTLKKYPNRTEQFQPVYRNVLVCATRREKSESLNAISLSIKSLVKQAMDADCEVVKVKAHKVWDLGASLLFMRN